MGGKCRVLNFNAAYGIISMLKQAFYKIMKKGIVISLALLFHIQTFAQKGGESTYSFLGLTNSARVAALGGEAVSLMDDDLNLTFHNPALLSPGMHNNLNLNYINYFAGVNFGYASYAYHLKNIGNLAAGIHYVNYGTFNRTDEFGEDLGTFRASEYALNLIYSRSIIDTFLTVGVNMKPIYSSFEGYSSLGLAFDVGLVYHNPGSLTTLGFVSKNMGLQITTYAGSREKLPFELQFGITQGLAHAPFRFSIIYQNLERWDLTYEKQESNDFTSTGEQAQVGGFDVFGDRLMRHLVFGLEFLLGENVHIDLGYNYKRRQEMKVTVKPGLVGFSFGFGFRISKFHIAYGRSSYHLAGGTNHFSLTTNLSSFYRKQ